MSKRTVVAGVLWVVLSVLAFLVDSAVLMALQAGIESATGLPHLGATFDGSSDSADAATTIVPLPASICILRRVKGLLIRVRELRITLAKEIPGYEIISMDIRKGAIERAVSLCALASIRQDSYDTEVTINEDDEETVTTSKGAVTRRRLTLLTFYTLLD